MLFLWSSPDLTDAFIQQKLVSMKYETIKKDRKNWALPGNPLTLDEFKKGIEEAEKGPFYTIEESKKIIAQWREARNSK